MEMEISNQDTASLSADDLVRYSRQIMYPAFGEEGQRKLRQAHVLIAGVGGLGSPAAIYLACAGVGRLTIVDSDTVELSNLNRQILHGEEDIGEQKVVSGARKLAWLNSAVAVHPVAARITAESLPALLPGVDVVIDCLDNMATRFIVNEACFRGGVPFIHGGISGTLGEITTIIPGQTPCLACMLPQPVAGKRPFPVFGCVPALIASLQVMEAIKLLAGFGELLTGKMLYANMQIMEFMTVPFEKNKLCKVCAGGTS